MAIGGLSTLTDANGNVTQWGLDGEGRVTSKTYAQGQPNSSTISYVYEAHTSRLHGMTDAAGNQATYVYNNDNTLQSTSYATSGTFIAPPPVSFRYDTPYNRVLTMNDGTGGDHL